MEDTELLAELQADLKEEGVEAPQEEIQAAIEKLRSDELAEDNLEDVAGGRLLITPLMPLPMLFAICPRCRKIYIRSKGHRCTRGHTSGGGRHA